MAQTKKQEIKQPESTEVFLSDRIFSLSSSFVPGRGRKLNFQQSPFENEHCELIEKVTGKAHERFRTLCRDPRDPSAVSSGDILQRSYSRLYLCTRELRNPQCYIRYSEKRYVDGAFDYDDLNKKLREAGL